MRPPEKQQVKNKKNTGKKKKELSNKEK